MNQKGFTLIELLIVIAILGILVYAVVASLSSGDEEVNVGTDCKTTLNGKCIQ